MGAVDSALGSQNLVFPHPRFPLVHLPDHQLASIPAVGGVRIGLKGALAVGAIEGRAEGVQISENGK